MRSGGKVVSVGSAIDARQAVCEESGGQYRTETYYILFSENLDE